jgi:hypothetical protein
VVTLVQIGVTSGDIADIIPTATMYLVVNIECSSLAIDKGVGRYGATRQLKVGCTCGIFEALHAKLLGCSDTNISRKQRFVDFGFDSVLCWHMSYWVFVRRGGCMSYVI